MTQGFPRPATNLSRDLTLLQYNVNHHLSTSFPPDVSNCSTSGSSYEEVGPWIDTQFPCISNQSSMWQVTSSWFSHDIVAELSLHGSGGASLDQLDVWQIVVFGILACIVGLLTIGGNLIVILSFVLERNIRQPTNYFIASLAVSDLLIGTISMPFYTVYLLSGKHWILGELLCDLWLSIDYTACLCSIYTVFCITTDRFCSVKLPAKYRRWRTENKVLIIVGLTWIIPISLFFPSIFGWQYFVGKRTVPTGMCYVQYMEDALFNCFLQIGYFWVTLIAMFVLYAGIYQVAVDLHKRSAAQKEKTMSCLVSMAGRTVTQIGSVISMTRRPYHVDQAEMYPLTFRENLEEQQKLLANSCDEPCESCQLRTTTTSPVRKFCDTGFLIDDVSSADKRASLSGTGRFCRTDSGTHINCRTDSGTHINTAACNQNSGLKEIKIGPTPSILVENSYTIACNHKARDDSAAGRVLTNPPCLNHNSNGGLPGNSNRFDNQHQDITDVPLGDIVKGDLIICNQFIVDSSSSSDWLADGSSAAYAVSAAPDLLLDLSYADEEDEQTDLLNASIACEVYQNRNVHVTSLAKRPSNSAMTSRNLAMTLRDDPLMTSRDPDMTSHCNLAVKSDDHLIVTSCAQGNGSFQPDSLQRIPSSADSRDLLNANVVTSKSCISKSLITPNNCARKSVSISHKLGSTAAKVSFDASLDSDECNCSPKRKANLQREMLRDNNPKQQTIHELKQELRVDRKGGEFKIDQGKNNLQIKLSNNTQLLTCPTSDDSHSSSKQQPSWQSKLPRHQQVTKYIFTQQTSETDDNPQMQRATIAQQLQNSNNRTRKALRTITVILGAFVVCWIPWHVLSMIIGFCTDTDKTRCVQPVLYDISYWLCYLNSPINPFCYALANQQFKKTFARILKFDWRRN